MPVTTVEQLKRRAARHRRSLQQELLTVLEAAASSQYERSPADAAAAIRERLAGLGRMYCDSADLIRQDRER